MKHLFIVLIVFLLSIYTSKAQNHQRVVDSLSALLNKTPSDTARARLLINLAVAYADLNNTSKAFQLGFQSLNLSRQLHDDFYEAYSNYGLGRMHIDISNFDSAIVYNTRARQLLANDTSYQSRKLYARATGNLANAWGNKGDTEKEMEMLISIIPIFEKLNDTESLAILLHNIAARLSNIGEYAKALSYLRRNIALIEKTGATENIVGSYTSAALIMYELDSLSRMKEYLDKTERVLNSMGKTRLWAEYYTYLGAYYSKQKKYSSSETALNKASKLYEEYGYRNGMYNVYTTLQQNFDDQKNYKRARDISFAVKRMAEEDSLSNYLLWSLKDISDLSFKMGDLPLAYKYLKKFAVLNDSIGKKETQLKLNDLELKYKTTEKEKEITVLKAKNEQARLATKNSQLLNWLLGAASMLLLVAVISILLFYRNYRRSSAQKAQIKMTRAMVQTQDMERTRVARDLHDGLGGMLTMVKLNLEDFARENGFTTDAGLTEIVNQLYGSVKELRRISHNMMPEMLLQQGLAASLKDLCKLQANKSLHIDFQCLDIQSSLLMEEQITIYRIIQELLANVVKHSGAKNVFLQCAQHETVFFITIEDDGKGFAVNPLTLVNGIGLNNIKSRVAYLQGKIEFLSRELQGTSINIELNVTT